MSEDLNLTTATVERLLTDTRQALERMRAPAGPSPSGTEEVPRGTGESADGRVQAVVEMRGLQRIIDSPNTSAADRAIAEDLLRRFGDAFGRGWG